MNGQDQNQQIVSDLGNDGDQKAIDKRLWKIFFPFAAEREDLAASRKTRFAYYTRAETATSILKTRRIWMRKSMCMNDFMEVQHGLQCLASTVYRTDVGKRFAVVLDQLFEGLWSETEKLLNDCTWHLRTDTYFTCVSEHKVEEDTLGRLSMWRAYGGTNGVALVMNNAPFQAQAPSDVLKIYASPVAYFDAERFEEKFGEAVTNIEKEADLVRQQNREDVKARIFRVLAFAAVCTKHPGFAEELEWRVIHFPWWESSDHMTKEIEVVQGVPQPVYKIPLEDIPEKGLWGITIPALFDRIIIGPTRDPLAMREAFAELLAKAGVEQPYNKIFLSNIPLRQ
jgi:hypothetical protein